MAQRLKNLLEIQVTRVQSLGLSLLLGRENGNPLQYSCLEKSMDRGAWQDTVQEAAKGEKPLFGAKHFQNEVTGSL